MMARARWAIPITQPGGHQSEHRINVVARYPISERPSHRDAGFADFGNASLNQIASQPTTMR